jgi:hypothetical protein
VQASVSTALTLLVEAVAGYGRPVLKYVKPNFRTLAGS